MSLTQAVYSVGTATQTVVAPTNDWAEYVLKNIQPYGADELARDGYVYALFARRDISADAHEYLSFFTGPYGAQFDYFQLVAETSSIYSEIVENPTVTVVGDVIPVKNLNRNYPDTPQAVIKASTTMTGGTVINSEFVTASNQGGGQISNQKIVTLKPNTQYVLHAHNVGNQTTSWYSQIGFSEQYNGYNSVWLSTVDNSFVIRPGEELKMTLQPNATINAVAKHNDVKLAVMRQE